MLESCLQESVFSWLFTTGGGGDVFRDPEASASTLLIRALS